MKELLKNVSLIQNNFNFKRRALLCKNSNCYQCPLDLVFKGLKIASDWETLDEIILNNKSISRFGDGEFKLIWGKNIGFQKANKIMSQKLFQILNNKDKNFLVGINIPYKELKSLKYHEIKYWTRYFNKYKFKLAKIINKKKKYYSATISRFYSRYKDKTKIPNYIKKVKQIWDRKNILIIEGEKTRFGVGNDLFNNIKTIKRIICPINNAFDVYNVFPNLSPQFM